VNAQPSALPRLLYYNPSSTGGLADYARAQANALSHIGVQVDLLSHADFARLETDLFRLRADLPDRKTGGGKISRKVMWVQGILDDYRRLAEITRRDRYRHVLIGAYAEYLSPLWSGVLRQLKQKGVVFGAIVHDPVRDFVLGPLPWHRRSVADAYSFLREAFVHEDIQLDTVRPVPDLRVTTIPHGLYAFPPASETRETSRQKFGLPPSAQVWLSFGHVRDGKNLHLAIEALVQFPDAILLVAGKEQSSGQRPVSFYQAFAEKLEVAARCFWLNRFIAPEEVGNLFVASDLVLLTYSRDFRSASGVLNVANFFRKPCLASSGQGNLRSVVLDYGLGVWVEPDRLDNLVCGLRHWRQTPPVPRWDDYERENSWHRNADIVSGRLFNLPS
jgi:glycosyltransferase involved in cell wall biosynthesis